jgi:ADP-heptose:LPS heptosyltransferase
VIKSLDTIVPSAQTVRGRIRHLQAYFVATLYALVNSLLRVLRLLLWPRRRPSDPRRICIYRTGFIGDTVCALPAMHAIRTAYPRAHLTLLTSPVDGRFPGAKELLVNSELFDKVQVYLKSEVTGFRSRLAFLRAMRRQRFDMWIDLPQELAGPFSHLRNLLIARLIAVRWGYGWGFVTAIRLWVQAQSEFLTFPNEVEKLLAIVRKAGIPVGKDIRFPITIGSDERNSIDRLLGNVAHRLIALAPGAKRSLSLWPVERYVRVGRYLASRGFKVLVLGGTADASVCGAVAEGIAGETINLAGRTSLKESCEVLKRCSMLICNDSGVQHLASAVRTPCISIFSAHDMPGKWYPYGTQNVVLRKWVECHTCYLQTCPYDNRCMKLIDVDEVIAAIDLKLETIAEAEPVGLTSYAPPKLIAGQTA